MGEKAAIGFTSAQCAAQIRNSAALGFEPNPLDNHWGAFRPLLAPRGAQLSSARVTPLGVETVETVESLNSLSFFTAFQLSK